MLAQPDSADEAALFAAGSGHSRHASGISSDGRRFIRYQDLRRLQQVSYTVRGDTNFDGPVQLTGIPLDALASALGVSGHPLIAALCSDGYEGHYTAAYRASHHPFLVLRIADQEPSRWPRTEEGIPYGPYLISHPFFTPAYQILAHREEAQLPIAVTELRFYDEDSTLARLRPPSAASGDSPAALGFRIAFQNCLRCHRDGEIGGTKSPYHFQQLGAIARGKPAAFGRYILHPNRVNPEATMPANPDYDAATIAALTAYFQSVEAPR